MLQGRLKPDEMESIRTWCRKWDVAELALFGSIVRADFEANSDIDLLVRFGNAAQWSLIDHVCMEQELESLLDRSVDLVTFRSVEQSRNWLRRSEILASAQTVYVDVEALHEP